MSTVDEYLKSITPSQKAEFERIRRIVKRLAPEAAESISYGIPTFKVDHRPLIYFGAFKNHLSLFPASDTMLEQISELSKYRASKGTLRYTEQDLIPENVIERILHFRLAEMSKH
jgi:uncharacterized protein YdhG (YjbR/CyaY superfamily)